MQRLVLLVAGLLSANLALGATSPACLKEAVGKKSCISGDTMICNRKFDPGIKDFKYQWEGINTTGQSFDVNNQLYKKVPGFTPAACTDPGSKTATHVTESNAS